jgi:hypothetical protein
VRILRAEIWACNDCTIYLCNGDVSGAAFHVGDEHAARLMALCDEQGSLVANFESETGVGIKTECWERCEICGNEMEDLHRFAELGEGPEELDHDGARDERGELIPIVGDPDGSCITNLYLMWAGGMSSRRLFVWAESFETAFEELVEYLDEHAPGFLSKSEEILADMTDEERAAIEAGEAEIPDHTMIGHTTLENGDCIPSWEWGGCDVMYEPTVRAVRLLTA